VNHLLADDFSWHRVHRFNGKSRSHEQKISVMSLNEQATTLCLLVKGNVRIRFPSEECILSHEGDYVIWPAGVPHRWVVTEDSLILTMRWPSTSGDCKEIGEAEVTGRDEVERERED
jgi:hypothetical protein